MSLNNLQYDTIIRSYEEKQVENRHLLKRRYEEVCKKAPTYKELDDKVSSISVAAGIKMLDGDEKALMELKHNIRDIKEQKFLTLVKAGFPENFLDPIYHCAYCKDTGYVESKKCRCFKQAIIHLLYEQSNIRQVIQNDNFSTLTYEYYQGDDLTRFKNTVDTCKNFVKNFNSDYQNLFFYGTVGTGKSFLSGCIAKELIEKGNVVIYFSSISLFEILSKNSFDYKAKEELSHLLDDLHNCDLLIIDDLGTELSNSFVTSQLFSCINERHIRMKSTIISTNLSLEEIRQRYSDRVFSRITSNYEFSFISGPDIRVYKKTMLES